MFVFTDNELQVNLIIYAGMISGSNQKQLFEIGSDNWSEQTSY